MDGNPGGFKQGVQEIILRLLRYRKLVGIQDELELELVVFIVASFVTEVIDELVEPATSRTHRRAR